MKHRKLFCEISPLCYEISVFKCCMLRRLRDLFSKEHFCRKGPEKLPLPPPPSLSLNNAFEIYVWNKFVRSVRLERRLPVVV